LKNSTSSIGPRPIKPCEMPGIPTFVAPAGYRSKNSDKSTDHNIYYRTRYLATFTV